MSGHNHTLFVSSYPDVSSAADDFTAIQSMEGAAVAAAVILPRGASGQSDLSSIRFQDRFEKHP